MRGRKRQDIATRQEAIAYLKRVASKWNDWNCHHRRLVQSIQIILKGEESKMKIMLDKGAYMPTRAHKTDAGLDLYAKSTFVVPASRTGVTGFGLGTSVTIGCESHDTGVHIEIPEGYVGMVKSKSGLNVKHGLTAEGVIDCGYTGSIVVKLYNHTNEDYGFSKGDKIAQLVIMPIITPDLELVTEFDETERGNGGFGSTGR